MRKRLDEGRIAYLRTVTWKWKTMPKGEPAKMQTSALLGEFIMLDRRINKRTDYGSPDNLEYNDLVLWRMEQVSDELDRRFPVPG